MRSVSALETSSPTSTSPLCEMTGASQQQQLRLLISTWDLLSREERRKFLQQPGNELASAIVDSLVWMSRWTKTRDDQDFQHPYKPLNRPYFQILHDVWLRERVLYVEKSRSMVTSWYATAEAVHHVMTRQPAKAILWAVDQDRSVVLRDYAWTLYEQQDPRLRQLYPVPRPRGQQSFDKMEFSDGGMLLAIPGKNPDKIRSEHPSVLVLDEACFMESGAEALDIALASKVPKIMIISTAAPSWIRRITKLAVPEELPI